MALRFSDGFLTALAGGQGYYDILRNCIFEAYSGTQPTSANMAPTGTKLFTATLAKGTLTPETRAAMTVSLAGITTAETVTSLLIGGVEILGSTITYATSSDATAAAMAAQINAYRSNPDYNAVYTSGSSFVVYAPKNTGTSLNGLAITVAGTAAAAGHITINSEAAGTNPDTLSATFGGVATGSTPGVVAVNGLELTFPTSAVLSKSGTWQGTAVASGTAAWGRFVCRNRLTGGADSGALDALAVDMRMDVAIGTSAATAEAVVASLVVDSGADQTINSFALTIGG